MQRSLLRAGFLSASCLALALGSASAQVAPAPSGPAAAKTDPNEVITLSVFEVSTNKDLGYQSANAAEVTRMNTPIENIPMNLTIFNSQFMEDILATDTSDLLAFEASAQRTTENDGFLARGSASVGANFLNGFAQATGNGSQPLANIDRVEVIRGPAAVLYGAGGYGGTINRITKQPQPKPFYRARTILRDKSSIRIEGDANFGYLPFGKKRFLFRLNGVHERGYTWFGQSKKEDSFAPSFTWQIAPQTKLVLEYLYNWRETQGSWETPIHNGDLKGITTGDGTYHILPRKINWVEPEDYRRQYRNVGSYNFQHAFSRDLQFRSQFQFEGKEQKLYEHQAASSGLTILKDTALMPRLFRDQPRRTYGYNSRHELVWQKSTGPLHHRMLFGFGTVEVYDYNTSYLAVRAHGGITNPSRLYGDGRLSTANAGNPYNYFPNLTYQQFLADPTLAGFNINNYMPINLFDRAAEGPTWVGPHRPYNYLDACTKTVTANQDYYFNDVFSFAKDRLWIMAGLRHSEVERRTIAFASGSYPNKVLRSSAPTVSQNTSATTNSTGAVWHLNRSHTLSLYANLNTSFNPEFRSQPDGSRLDPEEGKQKEIGLRFSFLDGRLTGLFTYFDILQDNVTKADPDPDRTGYYIQVSGQRSTGFELSWNARITDQWLVFGGVADTDARNDITGEAKDLQPQYRFTMFNRYNFERGWLKGLNVSLGTIYTGERPVNPANSRNEPDWSPVPEWWRVDATVGYKWKPKRSKYSYDASFKVSNLFDNREIYYVAERHRYTIDPGLDWQVVMGVRF
ncbi:TonB-dependent receptor plug domain-containing protein [Opitutus sp. ER46]|uniref:TonB-dependent siderophore receptor n=1 Tax=Opitutus sp. ER46 TaxID=2161864 RepID=UPI000D3076C8|nr:TonB-dependent receptor plug domain-containing protein [Opitutus sp. ER46]PTX90986.1 hypothetical protein DB354_20270 [Opitutus sp. ER46]